MRARTHRRHALTMAIAGMWLWLPACAARTEPVELSVAPRQEAVPGTIAGGAEEVLGVHVEARANTWGEPSGPPIDGLTPMFVRIQNRGPVPLAVAPEHFTLVSASGRRYTALPPERIARTLDDPTRALQAIRLRALPQDTVGVGASAEGFLYFESLERVSGGAPPGVTFAAAIVDAGTGNRLGVAEIDFAIEP